MSTEFSECEWGEFGSQYGPFKPTPAEIDKGVDMLQRTGWLDQSGAWVNDVLNSGNRTKNVYSAVVVKISEILESVDMDDRTVNFSLRQNPDRTSDSNLEGRWHKIDAFHFKKADPVTRSGLVTETLLANQGTMIEFKLIDMETAAYDNRETLTSSALYAMDEDPQRMWIYGVTIEDSDLRLWYYSRSHSMVSKPQDWKANPREMISVLMSFIFATTVELGYDPNVMRFIPYHWNTNAEYWIYRIPPEGEMLPKKFWHHKPTTGHFFKTEMCVAQHRSHRITGRATRVWKVIRVKSFDDHNPLPGEKTRVLKDVWLDVNAKTEAQIQKELFDDIEKFIDENQGPIEDFLPPAVLNVLKKGEQLYKRHFLTILSSTIGYATKGRPSSAGASPKIFVKPKVEVKPPVIPNSSGTNGLENHARQQKSLLPPPPKRQFSAKHQFRVVFDEVCKDMNHINDFGSAMFALQGGIIGLICMHLAGWVHRDISSGNILLFKDGENSRGILSDLEYAKKRSDLRSLTETKTGTPYFMAVTIQMKTTFSEIKTRKPERPMPRGAQPPRKVEPVIVKHNFIHDLESIWWLHLYTMVQYSASSLATILSTDIFTADGDATAKRLAVLLEGVEKFYPADQLYHQSLQAIPGMLEDTRIHIYTAHVNYDENITSPSSDFLGWWVYELAKFSVETVAGETIQQPAPIPEPKDQELKEPSGELPESPFIARSPSLRIEKRSLDVGDDNSAAGGSSNLLVHASGSGTPSGHSSFEAPLVREDDQPQRLGK